VNVTGRLRFGRRSVGAPTVVFVDDLRWDAFTQLSVRLRREGVRTVRLTTETSVWSRVSSWLLYDRHEQLGPGDDEAVVARVLRAERVVDLQFVETLSELVRSGLSLLDEPVARAVERRLTMMDKLSAASELSTGGVSTPEVLLASTTTPSEAIATFGLPVVAKRRVGCGGDSVVIARSHEELEAAAAAHDSSDRFYERFVDGVKLNYAAVVSDAGIEQELAYRVSRWRQPAGTATEVITIDDAQLLEVGRQALKTSGCQGLINLDVMRDREGRDWVLDFNARAFGGGANFLVVGLDVAEGYLRSLSLRAAPPSRSSPPTGVRIAIFPTSLSDDRNQGSFVRMAAAFLRESLPYLRTLGVRYWASELLRAPDVAASRRRSRSQTP
jgi:ATP-grasp domain